MLVFLLYWFFFLPGLVANLLYLRDAKRTAEIAGEKPSGYGALVALLFFGALLVAGMLVVLALVVLGGSDVAPMRYQLY